METAAVDLSSARPAGHSTHVLPCSVHGRTVIFPCREVKGLGSRSCLCNAYLLLMLQVDCVCLARKEGLAS
jgi:hypothetical protein